jgi:hypothetical protein
MNILAGKSAYVPERQTEDMARRNHENPSGKPKKYLFTLADL